MIFTAPTHEGWPCDRGSCCSVNVLALQWRGNRSKRSMKLAGESTRWVLAAAGKSDEGHLLICEFGQRPAEGSLARGGVSGGAPGAHWSPPVLEPTWRERGKDTRSRSDGRRWVYVAELEQKGNNNPQGKGRLAGEARRPRATGGAWRSLDAAGREIRQLQSNGVSCR